MIGFGLFHLIFASGAATAFVLYFHHRKAAAVAHVVIVSEWNAVVILLLGTLLALTPLARLKSAPYLCAVVPALVFTLQLYLYILNVFSNSLWGKNITYRLVMSYAPSVLAGKGSIPVGRGWIIATALGVFALGIGLYACIARPLLAGVEALCARDRRDAWRSAGALTVMVSLLAVTLCWGITSDRRFWSTEMIVSLFRPKILPFPPTPRRQAVGAGDAILRAQYPHAPAAITGKNVILIIVDSLRADHMQVYGYERPTTPFLQTLVDQGLMHKVDMALSMCSESYCGVGCILGSKELRDLSAENFTLDDLLGDLGWPVWFISSGDIASFYDIGNSSGARAGMIFDGSNTRHFTFNDDRVVLEGLEQVPDSSGASAFFYIHLMSAHLLGLHLAAYHTYTQPKEQVDPSVDPLTVVTILDKPDPYDDRVIQADDFIRQIFEVLRRKHYLDDAIVVVTGDHGDGLGERHFSHGWYLYQEDIRIPLLIYDDPSVRYANLAFATQVDVAPTILDRLGLPIPASWEGRSLLDPDIKSYSFHQTSWDPTRYAVVYRSNDGIFKYIDSPSEHREELYDLTHDPKEGRNLMASADAALVSDLRTKLHEHFGE